MRSHINIAGLSAESVSLPNYMVVASASNAFPHFIHAGCNESRLDKTTHKNFKWAKSNNLVLSHKVNPISAQNQAIRNAVNSSQRQWITTTSRRTDTTTEVTEYGGKGLAGQRKNIRQAQRVSAQKFQTFKYSIGIPTHVARITRSK